MILTRSKWIAMRGNLELLFSASFGRPIHQGYLDWRYIDNGRRELLFAVETANDAPVASYSAFPVDLICDSEVFPTAMSMTTMTHPDWRGKGLFPKLAKELYSFMEEHRLSVVWGFPNANSHLPFVGKLGWSDIYEIPTMKLDMKKADLRRFSLEAGIGMDNDFSLKYAEPRKDGLIRGYRTKEYLAWRYARNPENSYRNFVLSQNGIVSSYVVTKSYGDGIDLVDVQTSNSEEAHRLLSHIAKCCFDQNAKSLCCWAPNHHYLHGVLERLGFENAGPVTYFGGRELIPSEAPSDWLDHRNWYIQMGDSDVY